jgi:16S rRNA processing protein RimM
MQIKVGKIVSVHGIKGIVKIALDFEDANSISVFKHFNNEKGTKIFEVESLIKHKNIFLSKLKGVEDRNHAESLQGTLLYFDKEKLGDLGQDEFFIQDLKGLKVKNLDNEEIGIVSNVFHYPSGDSLEIALIKGGYGDIIFSKEGVPEIDIKKGQITINTGLLLVNNFNVKSLV